MSMYRHTHTIDKTTYTYVLHMCFLDRTNTQVVANEGGGAVFLIVSRSNGLESAVSVEWVTQSVTAIAFGETNTCLYSKSQAPEISNFLLLFLLSPFSHNKQCHDSFFTHFLQRVISQ